MRKTRVCQLLGIEYPILQGGMLWIADAGLAAAVSNAGGLGVISPMAGMPPHGNPVENLETQILKAKSLTQKPFGVNIPLDLRDCGLILDLLLTHKVNVVITAAGDPRLYTDLLHSGDAKVLHVISSVKHARVAESAGVDAVIAEGVEAAARNGFDELPLFSLIPQVADAVELPIIAAGGIADSRGIAAAFALGAEGVQLGTRFVAVKECIASEKYKKAIVAATDTDTAITCRSIVPSRSLKTTEFTQILLGMEEAGATEEELREFMGHAASRRAGLEGDLDNGEAYCGSSAGLIHDIPSVAEVIRRLVDGYPEVLDKL
ncbi:MAG: enoyl-[acyl-carrier-protein] reductase FabK [Desulfobacterium sp.]|nr:enoyl-[acyl-carrier-protein] reductase FabK [Desulfobacteraceae bacterium]MBA3038019.1 enoyl-[acyl-carrier-protein] reductase FabK [Desulfobacterium sp.]MBU4038058.1 nitronate monooxygenase [Pseudomonadota bacterium]